MFAVLFEVSPSPAHQSTYMTLAASLKPELSTISGFVENVRYRSLTRPGWMLSLSLWEDERALVRWRTQARHHGAQSKGRDGVFEDYRLRVGQTILPEKEGGNEKAGAPSGERLDVTEVGDAKCAGIVHFPAGGVGQSGGGGKHSPEELASQLGLDLSGPDFQRGLVAWDVAEAVLNPGEFTLITWWSSEAAGRSFCQGSDGRPPFACKERTHRLVRILRDYGKYDRREAPQYFEDALGRETFH